MITIRVNWRELRNGNCDQTATESYTQVTIRCTWCYQRKAWSNSGRKVQRPRPLWPLRLLRPCYWLFQ